VITTGPCAVVRHPSCSVNIAYCAGSVLCLIASEWWTWKCGMLETFTGKDFALLWATNAALIALAGIKGAALEDVARRREFTKACESSPECTRHRICPYIY
ncbi:hypothetical protein CERSUDRAFT_36239, partial [Gelatoporia subvermispora B]